MKLLLSFMLLVTPCFTWAADVEFHMIRFFDPPPVVKQRVNDTAALGAYLKKSQAVVRQKMKSYKLAPSAGFLVLAVRADGRTNAWLDMVEPVPHEVETAVIKAAKKVAPFAVKSGTVLVALDMTINGGLIPENVSPYPQEWLDYADNCHACGELDAETIVSRIWL